MSQNTPEPFGAHLSRACPLQRAITTTTRPHFETNFDVTKFIFILLPLICYTIQGFLCFSSNDRPHALVWWSYALGNLGFIWYEVAK